MVEKALWFSQTLATHSTRERHVTRALIRRKSLESPSTIVEVTKAFTEALANQLKAMVSTTKQTEFNKLEAQLKLFAEQMTYQREHDMRMYAQGLLTTYKVRACHN